MRIPLFKKFLGGVAVLVFPFWSKARQSRQRGTLRGNSVMPEELDCDKWVRYETPLLGPFPYGGTPSFEPIPYSGDHDLSATRFLVFASTNGEDI
jgi:hypothetical protein